jgi:uroporphyrinogen decarboxylase
MQEAGYDVVTLDTATSREGIRKVLSDSADAMTPPHGRMSGVQGNLDVAVLKGGADNTEKDVEDAVRTMLQELGPQNLIANLGEGLTGKEDPVLVAKFIDSVHSISEEMIKSA